MKRLKSNKSPGIDSITSEMIKHGGECVISELHQLCNAALEKGKVPDQWRKSVLVFTRRGAHWIVRIIEPLH